MQTGRNEPCPCGSGKKYKKCHLAADEQATRGGASDLEVAAIVDRAIHGSDWSVADAVLSPGLAMFSPGQPLEHVRFSATRGWSAEWQRRADAEVTTVLETGGDLAPDARDGLRLVLHVLRRFGASARVVEEVAKLEAVEREVRARTLATLATLVPAADDDLVRWLERDRLAVLGFADWMSLRLTPRDQRWSVRIAARVQDLAFARAADTESDDAPRWAQLAAAMQRADADVTCEAIMRATAPRMVTPDEQFVYAIITRMALDADAHAAIARIVATTRARGDHAGAAMLRVVR